MARQLKTDRARVGTVSIPFADGDILNVTYAQGLVTAETNALYRQGLRRVLAELLLSWDLLDDDGQPIQPAALSDETHWDTVAREARVTKLIGERVERTQQGQGVELPTDEECDALRAEPSTAAERRAAYVAAWIEKLAVVPNVMILRVNDAIVEDIRPGK